MWVRCVHDCPQLYSAVAGWLAWLTGGGLHQQPAPRAVLLLHSPSVPQPNRTQPHLRPAPLQQVRDDNLAFVQTCWTFINSDSLLTWAQKVGLDFHFAVEQRARSFLGHFFNFNGTAGV